MNINEKDSLAALSRQELGEVINWFSREATVVREPIRAHLERMIAVYSSLGHGKGRATQTLTQLRIAMGILPKSERGKQLATQSGQTPESLPPGEEYDEIRKKRDELGRQKREYDRKLKRLQIRTPSEQIEFDLGKPSEMLFSSPIAAREAQDQPRQVNRMQEFDKTTGLHVSHDYPKRLDFKCVVTEITYKVETLTDPETGKSVRASMIHDGPDGFQLTWGAVGNLIKMHVGFAIPINRMVLMIGQPEFSSSKICRVLQHVAMNLVGVYLALADELADVAVLSGDDTSTKVLEPDGCGSADPICDEIDTRLGWVQPRADGRGEKKQLNVSLLMGKSEKDPRSTIRFFRTHAGSVGNCLTKILESRSPKSGPVIFQGDLSSANLPTEAIRARTGLVVAGCGAHARRPFWRFRMDDESLCYFMLRGFLILSEIEARIDALGRMRENVLKLRGKYGRLVWQALKNRCLAATTGQIPGPATYPQGITPNVWPPTTELNRAANYVINHFEELTLYLKHPELEYTNNGSERAVRIEKCMLASSKFRKTKRGRVTLDILRTINATCTAAGVDLTEYLIFVFTHADLLHDHPERLTPFAFARSRDQKIPRAAEAVAMTTMPSA